MNWAQIIADLEAQGWTIYAIAKELGERWEKVNNWRQHEPKYSDGKALLELHGRITTVSSNSFT